jgi:uncharacterized protein
MPDRSNNEVMLALGDFQFSIDTAQYQTLSTSHAWRWQKKDRVGKKPARQFHGPDASSKNLDIMIYPQSKSDLLLLSKLKAIGDKGKPQRLVGGTPSGGADLGLWVIEKLDIAEQYFLTNGIPLEMKGTLMIAEWGEDEE